MLGFFMARSLATKFINVWSIKWLTYYVTKIKEKELLLNKYIEKISKNFNDAACVPMFFNETYVSLIWLRKNAFQGGLVVMLELRHLDALLRRCHPEKESQVNSSEERCKKTWKKTIRKDNKHWELANGSYRVKSNGIKEII